MNTCWDEVLGTMPKATLAVRREAFRQLLSGQAATLEGIAAATRLSRDTAREAVDLVVSVGMAETDDGTIIGIDGLTTRHTLIGSSSAASSCGPGALTTSSGSRPHSKRTQSATRSAGCAGDGSRSSSWRVNPRRTRLSDGCPTSPAQTRWRSSVRTHSSSARGRISMSGGGEAKRVLVKRWKSRLLLSEDGSSGSSSCRDGQAARSAVMGRSLPRISTIMTRHPGTEGRVPQPRARRR